MLINFGPGATSGILTVRGYNTCGEGDPSAGYPVFVTVGLEEMANQQKFRIHPNPAAGKVEIRLPKPVYGLEISIITSEGKVVLSQNETTISEVVLMDLTRLPAGLYLMKLSGQGFSGTERIVVQ
ncbi:MAG TPA: T9SS type A sorting domain-containing protein [Bacteroidales bacterium]|nr:T9SS type A sorting domain-containing protein [Bacteroidales bacterium]HRZ49141.1 T9SS type A sorting domain-containing protein [Bacteroidales bacterium]